MERCVEKNKTNFVAEKPCILPFDSKLTNLVHYEGEISEPIRASLEDTLKRLEKIH
jgi:hypothetical protein